MNSLQLNFFQNKSIHFISFLIYNIISLVLDNRPVSSSYMQFWWKFITIKEKFQLSSFFTCMRGNQLLYKNPKADVNNIENNWSNRRLLGQMGCLQVYGTLPNIKNRRDWMVLQRFYKWPEINQQAQVWDVYNTSNPYKSGPSKLINP